MLKILRQAAMYGLLSLSCLLAFAPLHTSQAVSFSKAYDAEIKSAVDKRWPDLPFWKLWKAQLYQESLLNPKAVSPVGARGLAQFMPATWREQLVRCGYLSGKPEDIIAVDVGACYMAQLRRSWGPEGRSAVQRNELAQASYNAGIGNIIKSQRACNNPRLWSEIERCLIMITGERNSHETQTYVQRIRKYWLMMEGGL